MKKNEAQKEEKNKKKKKCTWFKSAPLSADNNLSLSWSGMYGKLFSDASLQGDKSGLVSYFCAYLCLFREFCA